VIGVWSTALLAISSESAALALLGSGNSNEVLAAYFAIHALASVLAAGLAWLFLPAQYKKPRLPVLALLFSFGFFIPGLGVLTTVLVVQIAIRFPKVLRTERYLQVQLPQFSAVQQEATVGSDIRPGYARRLLADQTLALDTRLRVLIALQGMRPKAVVPLLQELLSDPSEDIRLLAYTMVDAWEKDLSQQLQQAQAKLAEARLGDERAPLVSALRRLAELHWELADTGLARGDLRRFSLQSAQKYCEDLLLLDSYLIGVWQLYAQVLVELNQQKAALRALQVARRMHVPAVEFFPLLAKLAYLRRDWPAVRKYMKRLPENAQLPHQLRGVAAYWRTRRVAAVDLHV
jgi:hypothetical protein